jgi:hypothetical protein
VSPEALAEGDTVADFGLVSKVIVRRHRQNQNTFVLNDGYESGMEPIESIEVTGKMGNLKIFQPSDVCFAFVLTKE